MATAMDWELWTPESGPGPELTGDGRNTSPACLLHSSGEGMGTGALQRSLALGSECVTLYTYVLRVCIYVFMPSLIPIRI